MSAREEAAGTLASPPLRWLGALAALASGCLSGAQLEAVHTFGTATAAVAELSSAELARMRSGTIAMNVARVELGRPQGSEPDQTDLDESFDPDAVQARVRAAEVLGRYAELLLALAGETRGAELQSAAERFVAELDGLAPQERRLDAERAQALGSLVQSVGRWAVSYRKARALRRIVAESGEQVTRLSELLRADFDPGAGRLATGYRLTADTLRISADAVLDAGGDPALRRSAVAAYQLGEEHRVRCALLAEQLARAVSEVSAAQAQLQQGLASRGRPRADELRELAREARGVAAAVKLLR